MAKRAFIDFPTPIEIIEDSVDFALKESDPQLKWRAEVDSILQMHTDHIKELLNLYGDLMDMTKGLCRIVKDIKEDKDVN